MHHDWLRIASVAVALTVSLSAANQAARYGTKTPYRLGQPIQYADFELTFRGGGTTTSGYTQREYWAFRVYSHTGAQLVLFYPPNGADAGKPSAARFRTAGAGFRLVAENRDPGPWDGMVTVTKDASKP